MKNTNYLVKKYQSYFILLVALMISLPCTSVRAQVARTQVDHYVGMYMKAGEWTLLPKESEYGPSYGGGGGIGALYELQAGLNYSPTRFLFDVGVGATAGNTSFLQSTDQMAMLENQLDLNHDLFNYVYSIKDRKDQYTNVAVQVPLLIGFHTMKFYMLVGATLTANMFTMTTSKAMLTTYGQYEMFDDMRAMPEYQFFDNMEIQGNVRTNFNFDIDLSAEIGGRLGFVTNAVGYDVPKRKTEYRLAAFVDYGLLDLHVASDKSPLDMPERYDIEPTSPNYIYNTRTMVDNLTMNDVMGTANFARAINSLLVGLKFTVLFQMPHEGKCVVCRDGYNTSVPRARGGSGVKYEE